MSAAYDAIAADYASAFPGTEPEQPVDLAMIDHFVASLPGARVLDAGCGTGRLLPYLHARGVRVVGVDRSPGMARCAARDHPQFGIGVASLLHLPFADGAFDGYFSWYSTIHLPDEHLPHLLAEAHRVLRPGGVALLAFQAVASAPTREPGDSAVRDIGPGLRARGHDVTLLRHHRHPDQLAAALSAHGFTESARLLRAPQGSEADPQAVLLATR